MQAGRPTSGLGFIVVLAAPILYFRFALGHWSMDIIKIDLIVWAYLFVAILVSIGMNCLSLAFFRPWRTIEITETGVVTGFSYLRTASWSNVEFVDEDSTVIRIGVKVPYIRSYLAYLIQVPKRAFGSPEEVQSFFDQAMAYRRNAVGERATVEPTGKWPPAPRG